MQTPYQILGVDIDATDDEIKQAYLHQVKQSPPDRDQQQFQLIHDAYTAIKDHKSRVSYDLFTLPVADFTTILDKALQTGLSGAMNAESVKKLLTISIDNASLLASLEK
ncbi:hypothetical protein AU255_09650 [Methyloprofundus sedimenti]|uniref:J domain-containing protein n=1 Tax=Methyloprofundus sedimenti TaxID=1420851 RepID=A0A1V8M964_9GAMM|nr:DnaJ domain-containing protein [Methyloprofundus sedimenti]OQK18089.1 hypothetical protein AU255_09650 [Methyloprofundus sedimenti]